MGGMTYKSEETFLISEPMSSFHQLHKESCRKRLDKTGYRIEGTDE